ncbi:major facilitator superfamily domain-containing protein [Crassisporium funariophilum]|nr:major facilitator superfamily domain-containing protein [Crassisporium funariophilum]
MWLQSGGQEQIQREFGVSHFVATLGVGLVNLGISIGPLLAAPLSELYGRQPMYMFSAISFTCFCVGCSLAPDITTLLICRFLAALCGSSVFSNFGGSLSDMFTPAERGPLVALFTLVLQGAPTIGPVPGSFLGQYAHWRWIMGLSGIWAGVITIPTLFLPETEIGAINKKHQRKSQGMKGWQFWRQPSSSISSRTLWGQALLTPLNMLAFEPIVLTTSLYHAFVYSLLFILLEAYPYVFAKTYGFSLSQTGLVFISPAVGNVLGVLLYFGYFKPIYQRKQRQLYEENERKLDLDRHAELHIDLKPEARLPGVLVAALLVPIGMFWFAATCSDPNIHYIVPILSGLPTGAGMTLLQLSLSNYYIDLYPKLSASALAANLFVRNFLATWFPTFAVPMYKSLGMRNASLVLAGISLAGIPGSWVLWTYGGMLRNKSRWAAQDESYIGRDEMRSDLMDDVCDKFQSICPCTDAVQNHLHMPCLGIQQKGVEELNTGDEKEKGSPI